MASPSIAPASVGSLTHSPRQLPRASRVWQASDVRAWPTVAVERLLRSTRRYECSWPISASRREGRLMPSPIKSLSGHVARVLFRKFNRVIGSIFLDSVSRAPFLAVERLAQPASNASDKTTCRSRRRRAFMAMLSAIVPFNQSGLIPADLTTPDHSSVCDLMSAANWSGVPGVTTTPSSLNLVAIAGFASALLVSALS